jgi:hypothetical protein
MLCKTPYNIIRYAHIQGRSRGTGKDVNVV